MRKIIYTVLCWTCWNNIAKEYCLVNVVQICLRQYCTTKLLAQCWLKAYRYTFAEKPAVSNMSGSLVLTGHCITEQSWLFLFNVGSEVHLQLAGQQWTGADFDWNSSTLTCSFRSHVCVLHTCAFVKNL